MKAVPKPVILLIKGIPSLAAAIEPKITGQYLNAKTQRIALNPSISQEFEKSFKEIGFNP